MQKNFGAISRRSFPAKNLRSDSEAELRGFLESKIAAMFGDVAASVAKQAAREVLDQQDDSVLAPMTMEIGEGEIGHDYEELFGRYALGATSIVIQEPWVDMDHQFNNLCGFLGMLIESTEVRHAHLVCKYAPSSWEADLDTKLVTLASELGAHGFRLTFTRDQSIHDRWVRFDTGWTVSCGRGLDLYDKPVLGWRSLEGNNRRLRRCKRTTVNALWQEPARSQV